MTNGTVITTPEGISGFRLLSLRGMVRLEKHGMKTRGGAIRPRIAAELGLKPRDSFDKFIDVLTAKIEASIAAQQGER